MKKSLFVFDDETTPIGSSLALRAAGAVVRSTVSFRNRLFDHIPIMSQKAPMPVISVGAIRAGGTGKTPVALKIGEYLASKQRDVAFVSRGYGRISREARIAHPYESASWSEIGDEPHLLHQRLPQAWVGVDVNRRRIASELATQMPSRSVIVLDDAFQHRAIRRDLDIVCLHRSLAEERVVPAGFLREPMSGLARAHVALFIGAADEFDELEEQRSRVAEQYSHLLTAVVFQEAHEWVNLESGEARARPPLTSPLLVCGIARPGRFAAMVQSHGISPRKELLFPDHHRFEPRDFSDESNLPKHGIITTEKDAIRLRTVDGLPHEAVWYLKIRLRFAQKVDEQMFYSRIDRSICDANALADPGVDGD